MSKDASAPSWVRWEQWTYTRCARRRVQGTAGGGWSYPLSVWPQASPLIQWNDVFKKIKPLSISYVLIWAAQGYFALGRWGWWNKKRIHTITMQYSIRSGSWAKQAILSREMSNNGEILRTGALLIKCSLLKAKQSDSKIVLWVNLLEAGGAK